MAFFEISFCFVLKFFWFIWIIDVDLEIWYIRSIRNDIARNAVCNPSYWNDKCRWFWCVYQKRVMIMRLKLVKLVLNDDSNESLWAMLLVKLSNCLFQFFLVSTFFFVPHKRSCSKKSSRKNKRTQLKLGKITLYAHLSEHFFFICFKSKINNISYLFEFILILNIGIVFIALEFTWVCKQLCVLTQIKID